MLPALPPSWDGFHPLVVHFPIALFVVAPLFVLLGAISGARALMLSALILLSLGVAGAFVATSTGEEAYGVMVPDEDADEDLAWEVVDQHETDTIFVRNVFTGITGLYAFVVLLAYLAPSTTRLGPRLVMGIVVLALCAWANLELAKAAHLGGELVHRYGVRAVLGDEEEPDEELDEAASSLEADVEELTDDADKDPVEEVVEEITDELEGQDALLEVPDPDEASEVQEPVGVGNLPDLP